MVVVVAACVSEPLPSASAAAATSSPSRIESASPTAQATFKSTPSATPLIALPEPGRPFASSDVLDAMRTSRRPGGVPDQVETDLIASRIADGLWTFDGSPWQSIVAGGACGPTSCTLEISGAPTGAAGEDLYLFDIDPSSGSVTLLDATLQGVPSVTVDKLDAVARHAWDGNLEGMVLASVRWRPPPDIGQFVLAYRSGGEEGSPRTDLVIDTLRGTVEPA